MNRSSFPDNSAPCSSGKLLLKTRIVDTCMIATCAGESCCQDCIDTIYRPILQQLEGSGCTGLVIDKRGIQCTQEKKSLDRVAETLLEYRNHSPIRKMALVTSIDYTKDELLLQKVLFDKGLNIRLFSSLDDAILWADAYP